MLKTSDKIIFNTVIIVITLIWVNYFIKDFVVVIFISFLIWLIEKTVFLHILNRYSIKKKMSNSEMEQCFALLGIEKTCAHFLPLVPECYNPKTDGCYMIINKNGKNILIFFNYKFSATSPEDVAKVWRYAQDKDVSEIMVLSKTNPRSVILLAGTLNIQFTFIESKRVNTFLSKHNHLPEKNFNLKKAKKSINLKGIASSIFVRKRVKLFLLSGISLLILSFFTPLTVYYLIMATVSFSCAASCFVINN